MLYTLRTVCPVKWTATQEKSISQEYLWGPQSTATAAEYVERAYLQFLWLPESIMPLDKLKPALLRVSALFSHEFATTSFAPMVHPLHHLLRPHLHTTRSCAEKWESTVPKWLSESQSRTDEYEMMCFSLKHEISGEEDDEEQWHERWLQRMERREVMMQILLYFLLLTLPGPPMKPIPNHIRSPSIAAPSPSPKKPRRQAVSSTDPLPLEERLEAFLDRLSMWQLMESIDDSAGGDQSQRQAESQEKGKDERDWMQTFCEDTIQPLFQSILPEQCELFREKVFPNSPFSDDTDTGSPAVSPPPSPKHGVKRTRTSSIPPSRTQSAAHGSHSLARTKSSLSVSLHEERERSKSLSVGPGAMRKRALTREVSMSTGFRGKAQAQAQTKAGTTVAAREREKRAKAEQTKRVFLGPKKDQGVTLVKATPADRQEKHGGRTQSVKAAGNRLPSMLASSQMLTAAATSAFAIEGDGRDHEWIIGDRWSPEIIELGDSLPLDDGDVEIWEATPTKKPKKKKSR